jgi:hypothetical protein
MDFDTGILSLIEGYVDGALSSTGTKRALSVPRLDQQFEGDTIPDAMPVYGRPPTHDDFDELTTAVIVQQRLIR